MFIVLRAWGGGGGEGNVIGCFPFPQQGGVMVEVFTNIEGVKILMSVTLTRIFTMLITVSSNTIYILLYNILERHPRSQKGHILCLTSHIQL